MPFSYAIIGLGGISHAHEAGARACPDLSIDAVCDIQPEVLQRRGDAMGIAAERRFLSHSEMLRAMPGLQAASVCTPNNVHVPIALDLVRAGIPYACEKPVGLSAAEAASLAALTRDKGLASMVCFSYRFQPAARFARQIVQSGDLGQIHHINGEYSQGWGEASLDVPLVWRFVKEITGSGALGDLGCHLVDLIRFLSGREFTQVQAMADTFVPERRLPKGEGTGAVDVDDYVEILGRLDDRCAVNLHITRFGYSRGNYQRVEIHGSKGAICYHLEDDAPSWVEMNLGNPYARRSHAWVTVPNPPSCRADQMQSFADLLLGKGDGLAATIDDGLATQKILDAVLISAESGARIAL